MRQFPPVNSPDQVRVIYAEDSPDVYNFINVGIKHVLGIEDLHHFHRVDRAGEFIESSDKETPTVLILDNNTPMSNIQGYDLATRLLTRQDEFANLLVVTVSSSDMGLAFENRGRAVNEIKKLGGEFWAKHHEGHLLLLWMAECLRTGQVIPREEWLDKLGIDSRYRSEGISPQENRALWYLCEQLFRKPEQVDNVLKENGFRRGELFHLPAVEVFDRLGYPRQAIEGQARGHYKER